MSDSYQQHILLPQCGARFLQLIEGSQEFAVLTHQEPVFSAILKNKNNSYPLHSFSSSFLSIPPRGRRSRTVNCAVDAASFPPFPQFISTIHCFRELIKEVIEKVITLFISIK